MTGGGPSLNIPTAEVFEPLLADARYKGAHGGRGSGKSHFFAEMIVERCSIKHGTRWLCGRQIQKSLAQSAKRLVEDKIEALKAPGFRVLNDVIRTPGDGLIAFTGMQEHTIESIKSYEAFDGFWGEEAHLFTQTSLDLLRPTIRAQGSELWFSWNPRRKSDPVDALLRGENAAALGAVVVQANWRDNPWFPKVLQDERAFDQMHYPDTYEHVWEGGYATVVKGAYYAEGLAQAKREGRITPLTADPLLPVRACWDLGVSDATAIWIVQFAGKEIRFLDYLEGEGQPLSYYVQELRKRGWGEALCVLPHDGAHRDAVMAVKFEDHLREAGFQVRTIDNQGKGAARLRIEAARRLFPRMWFDEAKTTAGRETIGSYHERRDDAREIGLGPEHDWASHGSDAFGLACIAYEEPKAQITRPVIRAPIVSTEDRQTAWMRS